MLIHISHHGSCLGQTDRRTDRPDKQKLMSLLLPCAWLTPGQTAGLITCRQNKKKQSCKPSFQKKSRKPSGEFVVLQLGTGTFDKRARVVTSHPLSAA